MEDFDIFEDFEEIEEHGEFGNFDTNMGFTPSPISWDVDDFGRVTVTDMFGQKHYYDSMEQASRLTDMLSGLPCTCFSPMPYIPLNTPIDSDTDLTNPTRVLLDKSNEITTARDYAVNKYNEAKASGDLMEMSRWRDEANRQQQSLYDLFGKSTYGLPAKAPGID